MQRFPVLQGWQKKLVLFWKVTTSKIEKKLRLEKEIQEEVMEKFQSLSGSSRLLFDFLNPLQRWSWNLMSLKSTWRRLIGFSKSQLFMQRSPASPLISQCQMNSKKTLGVFKKSFEENSQSDLRLLLQNSKGTLKRSSIIQSQSNMLYLG